MAVRFVNWSQTVSACPLAWHEPRSEEEVVALVRRADAAGRRVKAVGSGHSWSSIAVTAGEMICLRRMDRLLVLDRSAGRVTVEAGMRLGKLVQLLWCAGLAPPILGSILEQQVGGAIATATHGSSLQHGNLSSLVMGVRLITPAGEVLDLDERDERLQGARVHLGALGVVTRVVLRVEPAFLLEEEVLPLPLPEAIERLGQLARSAEYVKLWWLPPSQDVALFRYRRTEAPRSYRRWAHRLDEVVVNRLLFAGLLRLGAAVPVLVPPMNRAVVRAYFKRWRQVGAPHEVLPVAMPPRHREMEYAVPLELGGEALRGLQVLIRQRGLRVNMPVEVRFVRGDDAWLSPDFGRPSCHLGVYMAECSDLRAYFDGARALLRELGGRPHWGKELSITAAEVDRLWPEAGRFRALACALDPRGRMRNELLDAVLGPAPEPTSAAMR
ncbi:MAG: D-arabinono-1,4-lactone oxidase [Myxococcales bacterium]|nr:FAD-binding protein [Myxococcota bacterium]MDW8282680.1 D-arabinono-1,4-lactone oxidase [Myxococcales bacterium]